MSPDDLLARLEKVRPSGAGRYMACCPAHEDKSPSLSIKCCDDGRTLLHCHAGCPTNDVLNAIGLKFSDICSDKPKRRQRFAFSAR